MSGIEPPPPELQWLQLHRELDKAHHVESLTERIKRKSFENPFVPIGCFATLACLSYGLWCFRNGKSRMSQKMMRARVAAQTFTIVSFIVGIGLSAKAVTNESKG